MKRHIIKVKENTKHFYKWGVIEGEIRDGANQVHFWKGVDEINRNDFEVVEDESITPNVVWGANTYKAYLQDRSIYLDIFEQFKYEKAYNRLYKEEIDERTKGLARMIDLMDKGRRYENMVKNS